MKRRLPLCAVLAVLSLNGCTVIPKPVQSRAPSFDGNQQNSGVIAAQADGTWLVTGDWVTRYSGLIDTYGQRLGLKPGAGLVGTSGGNYVVTAEAVQDMETMSRWRREGR